MSSRNEATAAIPIRIVHPLRFSDQPDAVSGRPVATTTTVSKATTVIEIAR